MLFPVRDALLYMPTRQYGLRGKAFLGEAFFTADNPPFGATLPTTSARRSGRRSRSG